MRMLETTLLTGPYDWDESLIPRAEFEIRIAAVRAVLRNHGLDGLLVGGTSPEHGALGYLTGFVPKLGPALAFVPVEGELRLAFSGGGAMLPSARRLTFVTDIQASRDPEQDVAAWLREAGGTRFGLWGNNAIPNELRCALDRAAPSPIVSLEAELDALRRRKSRRELTLMRRACNILSVTLGGLRAATTNGSGVRSAALAAERIAYANGAQDVRMLVSIRNGGTPQPLVGTDDPCVDPLLACVAVRFAGYWAEGLVTVTANPTSTFTTAESILAAILHKVRPGVTGSELNAAAQHAMAGLKLHPFIATNFGNGIGLAREEAPLLGEMNSSVLQEGDVCTIRAGTQASAADSAIVSAMFQVGATGAERL